MPLTALDLGECRGVRDLAPLKDMALRDIVLGGCGNVHDLSPLNGMSPTTIYLPPLVVKGMNALREMKSITTINKLPAREFWERYQKQGFLKDNWKE